MNLSIQETAAKIGITSYTLRYYEKEAIIPKIERNSSGHRVYRAEDLDWIQFITCLKSTGMPIAEIKRFVQLSRMGDLTIGDRKQLLVSHKKRILSKIKKMNDYLERINWKIDYYQNLEEETGRSSDCGIKDSDLPIDNQ